MDDELNSAVASAQSAWHGSDHDYDPGSPHLRHRKQRARVESQLRELVRESFERCGSCRVIEVGAGHGTFTDVLLASGADVLVTEASQASAEQLRSKYVHNNRVEIFHDSDGHTALGLGREFDLAVCVSVLHHIPDYVEFVHGLSAVSAEGSALYSVQDPMWYSRLPFGVHALHWGAYFMWRAFQGDVRQAISTRIRRLRRIYDDNNLSDLVEYHVVRDGVDEELLRNALSTKFEDVRIFTYWSTQSPILQKAGDLLKLKTNFGIIARDRRRADKV